MGGGRKMSNIKRIIKLSSAEQKILREYTSKGEHPSRLVRRAQIILELDISSSGVPDNEEIIANRHNVTKQTVQNVKCDYLGLCVEQFLQRRKRATPPVAPKVDGNFEAHLIALCCSEPPKGYARWSIRMLADKAVELGYIESVSHMTVSRVLKKTSLSLI